MQQAGPGGILGGGVWGSATDGATIYTNIVNSEGKNFSLIPSNKTTTGGGWTAMDASSGKILWSVANPRNNYTNGPVSVANGVVFGGSSTPDGPVFAMDAKTGDILWSFQTNATVYGGVSIGDGCVYVGHGYILGLASFYTQGSYVFAFCL